MADAVATFDWYLRGDWFDVCSCKLPCPCSFAQEPTDGDCLFTLVWHIREGRFADVDLSGLGVVALGELTDKAWSGDSSTETTLMLYLDAKADPEQRAALERIFTGKEGGWPARFITTVEEVQNIEYAPINFHAADDLAHWRVSIPGKVDLQVEALPGPISNPNRRVTTSNAPGAAVGPNQVATWGVFKHDHAVGFDWSRQHRGRSSKHFYFEWFSEPRDESSRDAGHLDQQHTTVAGRPDQARVDPSAIHL